MAVHDSAPTDRDLTSISEARTLARRAKQAQLLLAELSQVQIDALVDAMAAAVTPQAEPLARLAVEETGYGVVADKVQKNLFASKQVYDFIRPIKTVGVINRIEDRKVVEIAEPFGVVAAVVPSTNPTSTAIYKILIAIKARCAIVLSPHPSAARCITRTAEVMYEAARRAGLPEGGIGWMTTVTIEGTQELMKHRDVSVILATGGMGLVRAAYSAGKPAYGVGPGNAPCYVESSADLAKAARDIIGGKCFDNGVLCSSPNSIVVDRAVEPEFRRHVVAAGGHFLSATDADLLARALVSPQRLPNPALVGKSAPIVAEKSGFAVPAEARALIVELKGVGRDYPLSIEKLCPVLSYYIVNDWREGCERCKEILRYGGMGHTMSIHSRNEPVILEFGLHKPAYRICVNTPTTHGSIGLTTGLDPAMTLGCGGFGGNITSDNISPRHLLNIKRLAYELRPASFTASLGAASGRALTDGVTSGRALTDGVASGRALTDGPGSSLAAMALPKAPSRLSPEPISADTLTRRIDAFLSSRGLGPTTQPTSTALPVSKDRESKDREQSNTAQRDTVKIREAGSPPAKPAAFVCEEDVRMAVKDGRTILVGERTIITPAARDAGEASHTFVWEGWRS